MTIELNPMGNACHMACDFCYLEAQREGGNFGPKYDLDAMKAALIDEVGDWKPDDGRSAFTLHGGDPLGMPIDDLTEILRWSCERWGTTSIQTTGFPITDRHVQIFEKYNVQVGVSIDGPGEMNDLRKVRGSKHTTREATAGTEAAIEEMRAAGIPVSVIVVLHKLNTAPERRDRFKRWIGHLDTIGVGGIRFHPMELDHQAAEYAPSIDDYIEFYADLHGFMKRLSRLRIDITSDIRKLLEGDDRHVTCTWHTGACDPYTTSAVRGVDGAGDRTNCGRTNKDGVAHPKGEVEGHERQVALYRTPQEHGGCRGCRWWFACGGQCVGEGLDGDWRARSSFCRLYKSLFRLVEQEMLDEGKAPLSMQSRREALEKLMDAYHQRGKRLSIHRGLKLVERGVTEPAGENQEHGDAPHGDKPHGDHTDDG